MGKVINPIDHLSDNFYRNPSIANMTMTRQQLKETLLVTSGWIMSCGHCWDIKNKHLGVGVYRITLKLKEYD